MKFFKSVGLVTGDRLYVFRITGEEIEAMRSNPVARRG